MKNIGKKIGQIILNFGLVALIWFLLYTLFQWIFNREGIALVGNFWKLITFIGTSIVLDSHVKIDLQKRRPLTIFGKRTGFYVYEGFSFLFWIFQANEDEEQDEEYQNIIIPGFTVECKDKVMDFSFNAKIEFGKSNAKRNHTYPDPTHDEEHLAHERFLRNKSKDVPQDFVDLLKSVCNRLYADVTYKDLKGKNFTTEIKNDDFFFYECAEWGIDAKNLLPFVQPQDMKQQNRNANRQELVPLLRSEFPGLSDQELARMANLQLMDVNSKENIITGAAAYVRIGDD